MENEKISKRKNSEKFRKNVNKTNQILTNKALTILSEF